MEIRAVRDAALGMFCSRSAYVVEGSHRYGGRGRNAQYSSL